MPNPNTVLNVVTRLKKLYFDDEHENIRKDLQSDSSEPITDNDIRSYIDILFDLAKEELEMLYYESDKEITLTEARKALFEQASPSLSNSKGP